MQRPVRILVVLLLTACTRSPDTGATDAAAAAAVTPKARGWGAVMADVGRRFELAGRAASARRFELAAYEVDELREALEELPSAELPKEGNTAILLPNADAFQKGAARDLMKAAETKNPKAFEDAFRQAAAACNGCHQASGHGFIEVPSIPGKPVPDLEPRPSATP